MATTFFLFTYGSHDGDGEQERLCKGPAGVPVLGHVVVVVVVVLDHEVLQGDQVRVNLE